MSDLNVFEIQKQSAEIRTRSVDFGEQVPAGVTISSVTLSAVEMPSLADKTSTVLQSATGTVDGTTISFTVKAGSNGLRYKITALATLSNGDKLEADVFMAVRDI